MGRCVSKCFLGYCVQRFRIPKVTLAQHQDLRTLQFSVSDCASVARFFLIGGALEGAATFSSASTERSFAASWSIQSQLPQIGILLKGFFHGELCSVPTRHIFACGLD